MVTISAQEITDCFFSAFIDWSWAFDDLYGLINSMLWNQSKKITFTSEKELSKQNVL